MTVLYPNLCYNEVCYIGTTLYLASTPDLTQPIVLLSAIDCEFVTFPLVSWVRCGT